MAGASIHTPRLRYVLWSHACIFAPALLPPPAYARIAIGDCPGGAIGLGAIVALSHASRQKLLIVSLFPLSGISITVKDCGDMHFFFEENVADHVHQYWQANLSGSPRFD